MVQTEKKLWSVARRWVEDTSLPLDFTIRGKWLGRYQGASVVARNLRGIQ